MRKVTFIKPIETLQGKLCEHENIVFCKGQHKQNQDCQWWQMKCHKRDLDRKPVSADELAQRTKFKAVANAVKNRIGGATREQDIAAMRASGFQGTFRQYLWKVEGAAYDQAQ